MVKKGRFYINLDVHWFDEWGCEVSHDAAILWILMLGKAKQMNSATLTHAQARSAAATFSTSEFTAALEELISCEAAPIGGDRHPIGGDVMAIGLYGFIEWNGSAEASKNGTYGNHIRWHVNTGKPDMTCGHCQERAALIAPIAPDRQPDRYTESESESKDICSSEYETEFDQCWALYPRKQNKGRSKSAFIARRRKGVSFENLLASTKHYGDKVRKKGTDEEFIMLGSTFYGSSNRWEDFLEAPPIGYEDLEPPKPRPFDEVYEGEDVVL